MADSEVKIVIHDVEYPFPDDYKPLDAVLIYDLTGMEYVEYLEALEDDNKNLRATPGLLGVVISRAKPTWSRGQIAAEVQKIGAQDWRVEGGEQPLAAGDAVVPPDERATAKTASKPSSSSSEQAAA